MSVPPTGAFFFIPDTGDGGRWWECSLFFFPSLMPVVKTSICGDFCSSQTPTHLFWGFFSIPDAGGGNARCFFCIPDAGGGKKFRGFLFISDAGGGNVVWVFHHKALPSKASSSKWNITY
ncbi:hypothetical protein NG798_26150 [Ancylothrix sp. C2]|uniref:hypothetical protein n=1 Tax=Ancylothrix sp. D3o TaxID=2953691 RepID=UPI0021BAF49D|nr:hypothetical protein [Ancylothrix sp. D3o]MCT7953286.1 hypothetical protein [Ancylothrix sp. D3o]